MVNLGSSKLIANLHTVGKRSDMPETPHPDYSRYRREQNRCKLSVQLHMQVILKACLKARTGVDSQPV